MTFEQNTNGIDCDTEYLIAKTDFFAAQKYIEDLYYGLFSDRQRPGPAAIYLLEDVHRFGELATTHQIIGHTRSEIPVLQSAADLRGTIETWYFVLNNSRYLITEY